MHFTENTSVEQGKAIQWYQDLLLGQNNGELDEMIGVAYGLSTIQLSCELLIPRSRNIHMNSI
jgi:hypothetical protein